MLDLLKHGIFHGVQDKFGAKYVADGSGYQGYTGVNERKIILYERY